MIKDAWNITEEKFSTLDEVKNRINEFFESGDRESIRINIRYDNKVNCWIIKFEQRVRIEEK